MEEASQFGIELYILGNLLWRHIGEVIRREGLADVTVNHAVVMKYLSEHEEVYQRDLEAEFQVNRSTITKIMQAMERRGYLRREGDPTDARRKQLVLTKLGQELNLRLRTCVEEANQDVLAAISPQEAETLVTIMGKLRQKLE